MTSLLLLDVADAFDNIFYERLIYNLRSKQVSSFIIK